MGLFDFGKPEPVTQDDEDAKTQELIKSLKDEIATLQQKNRILDGQNNAYAYTTSSQNERIAYLEGLLAEKGISSEVPVEENAAEEANTEVDELRKALEEKTLELEAVKKTASEPVAALEKKIQELEWSIIEKDSNIHGLEQDLAKYKGIIPRAQMAMRNYQGEINQLKQALSEAESKSADINKYQDEISVLKKTLSDTNLRCEELEERLQQGGNLEDLKVEIAGLKDTIASLEKQLAECSEAKQALQDKLDHYETAMSSVSAILNKF